MSAAKTIILDALFERARNASEQVMTERDDARSTAIAAMRGLEERLQAAIAGDVLRGLKNLAKPAGKFSAAHVGGSGQWGIDERLEWRVPTLCVSQDGKLVVAQIDGSDVSVRDAADEDLRIEDVGPVTDAVHEALERHVAHSERTAASYARASELSARLARAVG